MSKSPSIGGPEGLKVQASGGATGVRTPDLLNAIQTLSQLSYSPTSAAQSERLTADRLDHYAAKAYDCRNSLDGIRSWQP